MSNKPGDLKNEKKDEQLNTSPVETKAPGALKKEELTKIIPTNAPGNLKKEKGFLGKVWDSVGGLGGALQSTGKVLNSLKIPLVGDIMDVAGQAIGSKPTSNALALPVDNSISNSNLTTTTPVSNQRNTSTSSGFGGTGIGNFALVPMMVPMQMPFGK